MKPNRIALALVGGLSVFGGLSIVASTPGMSRGLLKFEERALLSKSYAASAI